MYFSTVVAIKRRRSNQNSAQALKLLQCHNSFLVCNVSSDIILTGADIDITEIQTHILGALNNEWVKSNALPLEL